ncbi:SGNH/GDSL hydrolase family protein [Methylophilus sp. 3sh_L]|uniref:SGNH/GDSL hydrolase family protein n=1 Tax=Methylophilus sp. 3sh_L TaxID=3377114 RepID=UPI00398F1A66
MQQILVYSDSLSWGIIPNTRQRLPFDQRWPGVLEISLTLMGQHVRVIEDCLNGRRTVFEDPFKPGRNGQQGLAQRIEIHSPLALVILMLGTNDFQSMHPHTAWHAAQGISSLVTTIRQAPIEPGMPVPPVMIVAPPLVRQPQGQLAEKFAGASQKSQGLAPAFREVSQALDCLFFDAGALVTASDVDGVHLDAPQHLQLGQALAHEVNAFLVKQA